MPHARKPSSKTRYPRSEVSRRDDLCSEEIRSIRADVQLFLHIHKRKKALEATRPRTASVTPTLNLVLTRARDTVRTLTTQLQNDTGENSEIRMYALPTFILSLLMSHLPICPCRLLATILQTANSLEKATGISEGSAKHKPLPLDTSLWILKRLLPFVRTVVQAKHTLLHPIHRLPVEILTEIFLHINKSNVGYISDLPLRRPEYGRKMKPLPTVFILGSVSSYWRKIAHSIPTLISMVSVTGDHLPPWWRKSLASDTIGKRGVDFFIHFYNTNPRLVDNTMNDVKVTWIRSATVQRYSWAALTPFLKRGPLSRLEELNFTTPCTSSERFHVPQCLSGTLRSLAVHECIPIFNHVFHELRRLSIIYSDQKYFRDSHWQRDWRTLATYAPNLEEFSLLHRSNYMDIGALHTTAKDVELDWTTIRSLSSLSPGMVKMPVERMRVRVDTVVWTDIVDMGRNDCRPTNGGSLMEAIWNSFFATTGLGQMIQHLLISSHQYCRTWDRNLLQPFTGLRTLELEGGIEKSLINSLSIKDSGEIVAAGAPDGARGEESQKIAVACPNLERLVIRNSDLDGEKLMRVICERNSSSWALKGKVRLLKHVEVWDCSGVTAETRRKLRLLRDQDVRVP